MVDTKLTQDELQRAADYEAIKSDVKAEIGGEIADNANMRQKAVDEVIDIQGEVERGRFIARISQIVDYLFYLVYGLLAIRLMLALFAANNSAGFVQLIKNVTDPFYAPFKGIVPSPSVEGGFTLALPIIVAIVIYILIHLAINGLLRIFVHRKTTV